MKVKPLGNRVLVKRHEPETKTESGLYLPESAAEKPQEAEVVAVGDGKLNEKTGQRTPLSVKAKDTVLLGRWGGTEVKVGGEELLIVNEDDILGVLE